MASGVPEGHRVGTLPLLVCEQDMGVMGNQACGWSAWQDWPGASQGTCIPGNWEGMLRDNLVGGHVVLVPRQYNCTSSWVQTHI